MNNPGVVMSGSIRCNSEHAKAYWNDGSIGYLQQNDFLMPFLTVRESLQYAAHLRLPRTMSSQKKRELVELVLLELGLKECADTRVGDPGGGETGSGGTRGISGGERRRVSAGVQLLTNPKMLLCDEVTSGLDAFSSYEVVKSLTNLAKSTQKTIVISIHQPRSEIFRLLLETDGQIVLLSKGDIIYSGPIRCILSWIESTGISTCPSGVNPFDYLLDISMVDYASESIERQTAQRRQLLVKAWAQKENNTWLSLLENTKVENHTMDRNGSTSISMAVDFIPKGIGPSLYSQVAVLTSRGWRNQIRDHLVIWGCVLESIVVGLVVGSIFYQINGSMNGIHSRAALVYTAGSIQPYLMLMINIFRLSREIVVYDRERADRWYGPVAHIASTFLNMVPLNIVYPIVFSSIVYYLTGLRTDSVKHFVWWLLACIGIQFVACSFALFCTSAVRRFWTASLLASGFYVVFTLSTGFLILPNSIPGWLQWIQYLAYSSSFYKIMASNEFTDNRFDCPYVVDGFWDPVKCAPWDGNHILINQLDVEPNNYPGPIIYFVYYIIAFLALSWLALTLNIIFSRRKPVIVADTSSSLGHDASGVEETRLNIYADGLEQKDPVTIRVENLSLSVSLRRFQWSLKGILGLFRREEKQMLKDVDAIFPAGELTVILGGSGAGKTSLLNVLLHRTASSLKTLGSVFYNGTKNPSLRAINGVSSYVRQDDNFLLSHLTVRETLRYAAELRMDSSMPKADMYAKVEVIIDLLGLRECADVIVGNSAVRGCSGGQRRRVSIGIQLVTEPACLFLDEPTSGLDAMTAKTVVLTLKRIAATGRTVVCTIHQPRADIWHVIDNVVLLVTGGRAAYTGQIVLGFPERIQHLHLIAAPSHNLDFVLDTASVNLRSIELEQSTRQVVDSLVERFNANKQTLLASQLPPDHDNDRPLGEIAKVNSQTAPFNKAFPILARRSFVNAFRQKGLYFNRILQPVVTILLTAIFFVQLGNGPRDVTSRIGMLQQTAVSVFTGMLNAVALYTLERDIAYREISDGSYSATAFFASFLVNEFPLELISSFWVTVVTLTLTQMKNTAFTFFTFWVVMLGYTNVGESIGIVFSTFSDHSGFSFIAMSAVISMFSLMTGFLSLSMPQWLEYVNYISVFKYGSVIAAKNEFEGRVFDCSEDQIQMGACPFPTGQAVLDLFEFDEKNWTLYMILFVTVVVVYRLLAWLILVAKVKSNRW
ncbi:P-loop containing nucleoside triphosphate hydrolase protein [Mortierella sp. GBAus27b]|nr:P-loop containing nucleoside triphosphate hydrolase protein [Mortierella sp. GBAus27b]